MFILYSCVEHVVQGLVRVHSTTNGTTGVSSSQLFVYYNMKYSNQQVCGTLIW